MYFLKYLVHIMTDWNRFISDMEMKIDRVYIVLNFFVFFFHMIFSNEKQSDLAEQIESVAYILCGNNKISNEKFFQIFQEKGVSICE